MNNLTIIKYNEVNVTDSRNVAEVTDMRHDDLLKKVRWYVLILDKNIIAEDSAKLPSRQFFIPSTYINSQNKEQPCYLLTRRGCDMVANKMTGEKGVLFTAAYVTKFEEMEKQVQAPQYKLSKELQAIFLLDEKTQEIESRVGKLENTMTIDYSQQEEIRTKAAQRVLYILGGKDVPAYKELNNKAFAEMWRDYKKALDVNSYRNTAVKDFNKGLNYVVTWKPNRELELMIAGANSQIRI
jgi:Rha family phage regulatory protein